MQTEVYMAFDDDKIYFGLVASDPEAESIVATQLKRDSDLNGDDFFALVLDPFLDLRNGYYFAFNALGARRDALIRGGATLNADWDGIWDVVTNRTAGGWVAEGFIPFSTLSFKSDVEAWGLNMERVIARSGERLRWNGTQRQFEVNNLANAGRLRGLAGLQRAAGFELRPSLSITYSEDSRSDTDFSNFKPSFDLFYKLTESTTAVVTVNTDFADAEVDDRVVNLTRFPVKFPEKRAFFLQDAGVFSYSLINNNPLPYYSRRMGLGRRGEIVDIVAGARISGREGPVNFGVLGVRTEAAGEIEAKDLAVARVLLNLSDEAGVGVIATSGDPLSNGNATLFGLDLNYTTGDLFGRPANLLDSSLYYQTTSSTGRDQDSEAYGWGFKFDSPTWGFVSYLDRVGIDYFPALGSVRQTGVSTLTGRLDYEFNPESLKSVVPTVTYVQRDNLVDHELELETYGFEVTAETQRGETLLLRVREEWERLPSAFSVGPGVKVLPGAFSGQRIESLVTTSKSRPFSGTLGFARIPYYGGYQTEYSSSFTWRPNPLFNVDSTFEYTDVALPYAQFPVRLVKAGATLQFSKELIWSALGQFDNISESIGFNTRLRWTYAPGSDVYLVFNQGIDASGDRWDYFRFDLSAKVGATYRF
ncbi:carbohydrate binding family 9 domain-containing protein [Pelagicoccus sp. NFK12]|uniref:Carbohydrate binding family 9 domain-containing protein n=1 Tax=Pelagicoccus enzymogenes TaxID=2773457 RepID=A0A927IHK5_9BACT|nr:carbohydrate binding family 9 domain-containing protein [Pelagicoccus enzymogenes]MBD5779909.1 carbohydrate binding family 9 domain-containing protein [Pelagicoccus enzymogenes]